MTRRPLGDTAPGIPAPNSRRWKLSGGAVRRADHPPMLMYHGVGRVREDPFGLFVTPERFHQQMRILRSLGLRGVSVEEFGDALARREADGLVGITFDDGYREILDWVPEILARHGFTATVFAVTGLLGADNTWDPPPRRRLMRVEDLRELVRQGMEVGSHSLHHVHLAGADDQRLREEVAGSRLELTRVLDRQPRSFCYPYGSVDAAAVQAVQDAGYTYACAVWRTPALPLHHAFPRVGITQRDRPLRFLAKLVLRGK